MNPSGLEGQYVPDGLAENFSPLYLLEQGLRHIQQEHYVEGVILLARARDQLPAQYSSLTEALDNFTEGHTVYRKAHQELHHAIRRFAEEDTAQRTRLSVIEKLVSALREDVRQLRTVLP